MNSTKSGGQRGKRKKNTLVQLDVQPPPSFAANRFAQRWLSIRGTVQKMMHYVKNFPLKSS